MNYRGLSEAEYIKIIEKRDAQIRHIQFELDQLKRAVFGSKSERFVSKTSNNGQLDLFGNPAEQQEEEEKKVPVLVHVKKKKKPKRKKLPDHLERKIEIIEPEVDTSEMRCIGEQVTEKLEVVPAKLFVRKIVRPKYVDGQEQIHIAEMPAEPFPKCMAGSSLGAQVAVQKYVDHLPLYRQSKIYKREKIDLARSTLNDIIRRGSHLLLPLWKVLKKEVLRQMYLMADESSMRVLNKDSEKGSFKGQMLMIAAPVAKLAIMIYIKTKEKNKILPLLKDVQGYLQVDGNSTYESLGDLDEIDLLFCMAHARRYFEKALDYHKEKAEYALVHIGNLYVIERKIKEFSVEDKYKVRQEESVPILNDLKDWLDKQLLIQQPQNPLRRAVNYVVKRWKGLTMYTTNGMLQIDNNLIERQIRSLALGRKNYLFAGAHTGAEYAALYYSLFATCRLNGIEPFKWLTYVFQKIQEYPINQLQKLLPTADFSYE